MGKKYLPVVVRKN